ncbi:MAG TPA: histidine kinase dimerization/phospho-acceptor domain-containing protein [Abditibacteriaceae bacterium]|jgi:signal transduction histidine kinase
MPDSVFTPDNARESACDEAQGDPSRRAWLAHVRHELRTPLNAILGYSEMLLEDARDCESPSLDRVASQLFEINEAGRRLLQTVNDSLDAARLHAVRDDELPSLGILVRGQARGPLIVILNSASQALQEIASFPDSDSVSPEIEKIQTAATRLQSLLNDLTHFDGTTLEAPDTLSHHGIERPDAQLVLETLHSLPTVARASAVCGRILVTDDNAENRDLLQRRLARSGHEVVTASDGEAALELLLAEPFDVLLLDLMMPRMNGYQVLETLKQDAALRHLPVIIISALDEKASAARCLEIGADDYLSKPFEPAILQARIGGCLEKKRLRDADIALREEIERNFQQLREAENQRDSMSDMIVHDLRTPLTSFMGGLRLVGTLGELNAAQKSVVEIATRGGETLLSMINDLLDVSKIEAGALKLEIETLSVTNLVEAALDFVSDLVRAENQTLIPEIAPDVTQLRGDAEKLRRTLVNLLGNATKFTPRGGVIVLKVSRTEENGQEALLFAVEDTGPGIPREAFDTIFEKFGQAEQRSLGQKFSTGLGLTFCKLVVEAHGGRIWVESEIGVGSTFSFTLPL